MRISDWSSDVCSSDLYRAIFGAVVVQAVDAFIHEGGDEQRHADRQVPAEAKARQRILADMGDLVDEAARAIERQHRDQRRGEHPRCRGGQDRGGDAGIADEGRGEEIGPIEACARRHQVRSEEHTYELQSLMRISYAVFCLKKKKKPTRLTTKLVT